MAINKAIEDVRTKDTGEIPMHIRNAPASGMGDFGYGVGYKYPHDYPNRWVDQTYLPNDIKGKRYYEYGDNKTEQAARAYWEKIKNKI